MLDRNCLYNKILSFQNIMSHNILYFKRSVAVKSKDNIQKKLNASHSIFVNFILIILMNNI